MNLSEEQQRIDLALPPKRYRGKPPAPGKPKPPRRPRRSIRDRLAQVGHGFITRAEPVLAAVLLTLRRPITLLGLAAVAAAFAYVQLRPAAVEGSALPSDGWKTSAFPPDHASSVLIEGSTGGWVAQGVQVAWFSVDMGRKQTFHQVVLDAGANENDYPREYAVYLSDNGIRWGNAVAAGEGNGPITIVSFARTSARYIKVVDVAQEPQSTWSLSKFTVH